MLILRARILLLSFRIIGKVNLSDLDHISSSAEGLQVKGKGAHSVMNMTFKESVMMLLYIWIWFLAS